MMVLLLGLILAVFTIICAVWAYWDVSGKGRMPLMPIIVFVAGMLLYTQIQPSYLPKGTVPRSTVPEFQEQELEVRDRTSKPMSGEERDRIRHERYREGLISN